MKQGTACARRPNSRAWPVVMIVCLLAAVLLAAGATFSPVASAPCERDRFEGSDYTVCVFDLREHSLRLLWRNADGQPYALFRNLPETIDGERIIFAMNAGMYHADLSPVGLYVEDGRELRQINTADGPGNFHLKPNGVFYVAGERAGVLTTSRYIEERPAADHATQSGPMLLIDGELHPRFLPHSTSRRIRNGVGVRDGHSVVFAISEGRVTFHEFGRFFRDRLGTPDGLYLAGTMSSMFAPALGRADARRPMGPIIAAFERGR
jgi:uncharacterized protein YigE (DUF2233 family)